MRLGYHFPIKQLLLTLIVLGCSNILYGGNGELKHLSDSLQKMIDEKPFFVQKKEQRIEQIKSLLKDADLSLEQEYAINFRLYNEYKKFVVDSAIHYMERNVQIASQLNNLQYKYQSDLHLSLSYSMCGKYREAELILKSIDISKLSPDLLLVYYDFYSRFWEYYSISIMGNNQYSQQQREAYQDSLLSLIDHTSFEYKLSRAYYYGSRDSVEAQKILQELLDAEEVGTPRYAVITYSCAVLSRYLGKYDDEKKYFMLSAIADIQNATRETASLQTLALRQYEEGNLTDAFKFTQAAIDDIISSGIHSRAMEIYKFYSIINTAHQTELTKSKSSLVISLITISIILFLLILLIICIYVQMKKTLRIKQELVRSNEKLLRLNDQLNSMNNRLNSMNKQLNDKNNLLFETNDIKERYIAEFFDVCFNYINKMEKYQNSLYKIAVNRYYDELIQKLKSPALINEELNALYARFDKVFLSLYPTFVSDFNALLKEGEKIVLKSDALLNRELRIYALLRLGISDSGKIANFLRCSTSTVYNYRTKMRNKSAVHRDEFENEIMKICLIDEK